MLDKYLNQGSFDLNTTRPAGFWIRVAAYLIDILIIMVIAVPAMFIKSVPVYVLLMVPIICYKPVLEGLVGGTAGKLALGLKVISASGEKLGLVGGFVRSGIFILPTIPQMLLQVKMIQEGISSFDPQQQMAFQEQNELLVYSNYGLSALVLVSCLVVAWTARKRGLHDMIADSYVIRQGKEEAATA